MVTSASNDDINQTQRQQHSKFKRQTYHNGLPSIKKRRVGMILSAGMTKREKQQVKVVYIHNITAL